MIETSLNSDGEPNPFEQIGKTLISTGFVDPDSLDLLEMTEVAEDKNYVPQPDDDKELLPQKIESLQTALGEGQTVTAVLLGHIVQINRLPIELE